MRHITSSFHTLQLQLLHSRRPFKNHLDLHAVASSYTSSAAPVLATAVRRPLRVAYHLHIVTSHRGFTPVSVASAPVGSGTAAMTEHERKRALLREFAAAEQVQWHKLRPCLHNLS
jgi:hypothetical protein